MPSVEDMCILPENTKTTQDFLARDMEELVSEIKENLRLSGLKARHTPRNSKCRKSPYSVPSHSWNKWDQTISRTSSDCNNSWDTNCLSSPTSSEKRITQFSRKSSSNSTDDPYEMLQALLRDGRLIKEAVRRLHVGLAPK